MLCHTQKKHAKKECLCKDLDLLYYEHDVYPISLVAFLTLTSEMEQRRAHIMSHLRDEEEDKEGLCHQQQELLVFGWGLRRGNLL